MKAHQFSLPDQNGNVHTLSDYGGKWVILYFYPKDDTPGCTKEACAYRDISSVFQKQNAVILGISKDSVASHKKFTTKYSLPFPLLSDPELTTIKAYGAWGKKKFLGREYEGILRNTYLINPKGEIVKTYEKVDPVKHIDLLLSDLSSMSVVPS